MCYNNVFPSSSERIEEPVSESEEFNDLDETQEYVDLDETKDDSTTLQPTITPTSLDEGLKSIRICLNIAEKLSLLEHIPNLQTFEEHLTNLKVQLNLKKDFS